MNDEFDEMMGENFKEAGMLVTTALTLKELFDSYTKAGFTEEQAIDLVKVSIVVAQTGGQQ